MSNNPTADSSYDQSTYWTAPARNFRSSARLHLQHYLFQNTIGYLLEPAIEKALLLPERKELKVADLACGNGVWLTELHSQLAKNHPGVSAQLDGFDIHPINFPHESYLPSSVTLRQLDILAKPFPNELLGKYDVVHIRAFVSIVGPDSDLTPILTVAKSLLKPGGFLQWEETRGDRFYAESPSADDVPKSALDKVLGIMHEGMKARGINNAWVEELHERLADFDFLDTRLLSQDKRRQDYKAWTEDYLMTWEELANLFPSRADKPDAKLTREDWVAMFAAAVQETEKGAVVHQRRVLTAVGRKRE